MTCVHDGDFLQHLVHTCLLQPIIWQRGCDSSQTRSICSNTLTLSSYQASTTPEYERSMPVQETQSLHKAEFKYFK